MQTVFEQLLTWADKNHIPVNYSKTKEMIMGPPSITANLSLIKMTTGHIEWVNSTLRHTFGLFNFSWQPHIEAILAKATQWLHFLIQLTHAGLRSSSFPAMTFLFDSYTTGSWIRFLSGTIWLQRSSQARLKPSRRGPSASFTLVHMTCCIQVPSF